MLNLIAAFICAGAAIYLLVTLIRIGADLSTGMALLLIGFFMANLAGLGANLWIVFQGGAA